MKKQLSLLLSIFLFVFSACGTNGTETSGTEQNTSGNGQEDSEVSEYGQEKQEKEQAEASGSLNRAEADKSGAEEISEEREETAVTDNSLDEPLPELKVHYIDVGQADAALVEFGVYAMLIDAGNWNSSNVVNYLAAQDIQQLDIVVGTHPDADHIGQLDKVIEQVDVGEVWMSGNASTSQTFQRVMEAIEANGVDYDEPRAGDVYDIGQLTIDVLYPSAISGNANQESISLKLTYGDIAFVFTGDAETVQEQEMINRGAGLDADILQLGHHGSSTSTSKAFLEKVSPAVAIYSSGTDNQYGHPHEEVINRLNAYGTEIYGTTIHGTIIVTTDGVAYQVTTKEDGNITPGSESKSGTENEDAANNESTDTKQETSAGQCVNINEANVEEVQEIKHIGPERAQDLIDLRPYQSVDDLTKIKGIGPSRMDDIHAQGIACIGE
ncbi:MBL fold metallo-hydrolase [Sediminibacillus albus]|uniref:Metal-dependent hydrolase, beta-lactamase superfamily II n=1 Tax=Sediminibacillus albus TaxID=407036 RepID=A0A1G8WSJ0_9BACI|nr:MBL fold metallo-hydrolase [Sediminibacillus albus]SDJ80560.1 Metal-dependent hydrolase, beta-lactamase superfamily II [Sediminibacillus albus]